MNSTALVLNNRPFLAPELKENSASKTLILNYELQDRVPDLQFEAKIQQLSNKYSTAELRTFQNGSSVTLDEVKFEFKKLFNMTTNNDPWKKLNEDEKVTIEKYKLYLMKAIQDHLQKDCKSPNLETEKPREKPSKLIWFLFGSFLLLELIPMIWGGFLGISELISVIPWLSKLAATVISSIACGIEAILYYAVMGPLLKEAFELPSYELAKPRYESYGKQLEVLKNIDLIMTVDNKMNSTEYNKYSNLIYLLNEHAKDLKQTKFETFKERPFKKGLRWVLAGINVGLNVGGGYFFALALLAGTATTAALIGTPLGWGIIGFVILGQIALRFAIRSNGMFNMLNPEAERYKQIRENVHKYKPNTQKHKEILSDKRHVELLTIKHKKAISELDKQQLRTQAKKNPYVDSYRNSYTNEKKIIQPNRDPVVSDTSIVSLKI